MAEEKKQNLESALSRLEKIIEELNSKDTNIEEGMKKFKEGAGLIAFCRNQLKKAEQEFREIKEELKAPEGEE
ncbi:MAG: exodeoxyribonuclease VII small subunit [Candidatus Yanofskybacteria bacterium]|nr:exodeoxyribonuclease VII small subunit [Candidatus Yanofskybacteria bacterium]